ncbi:MAG: N(4)-(beta-N-acetylglucosaminyl)-L-asparaginase, partial [Candidatus Eisenbacteria sp.]|nr:N(4)-(beta-N-acetylglucosaminyl)-L-asparaginase [Candidatus Eisenbacteria bacterium]
VVIATWKHGRAAGRGAWDILASGGSALDAVENGVNVSESDPDVTSVGYGGLPDEDGRVTLDACIMGPDGRAGAVACIEGFRNPSSVARKVMEYTDHVLIVDEGARRFARSFGFREENLLTDKARERWLKWKMGMSSSDDWLGRENHDTVGVLALDGNGDLAGACSTSGLAFKIHGRVGDSPLIGAGLYVDNKIGAAAATGKGEAVIKIAGSFLVVEFMRMGASAQEACEKALDRMIHHYHGVTDFQNCFIAVSRDGEIGAASLREGFEYSVWSGNAERFEEAPHVI